MEQHSHPHNDRHLPLPLAAPQASGGRDQVKPQAADSCCVQTSACTDWNSGAGLLFQMDGQSPELYTWTQSDILLGYG